MKVRALIGVRQESLRSGIGSSSVLSRTLAIPENTGLQNDLVQSHKSMALSSAATSQKVDQGKQDDLICRKRSVQTFLPSYLSNRFIKQKWQSRNRSVSVLKQSSFKAKKERTESLKQKLRVKPLPNASQRIQIHIPPGDKPNAIIEQIPKIRHIALPQLQLSNSLQELSSFVHYSARSGPEMTSVMHSENSLENFQRRELRRIKEEVFKIKQRRTPSRMKSIDMQPSEEAYETPRARVLQTNSMENTDTLDTSNLPTLTKMEPRMTSRIEEFTEQTEPIQEKTQRDTARETVKESESLKTVTLGNDENKEERDIEAPQPRARLAQHDNSLHYSNAATNSNQSEQPFDDLVIQASLAPEIHKSVRPRFRGVKLSEIKSISSKSSRISPKTTEGIMSGDLSLHNIGVSFSPKLGSVINMKSSFAGEQRRSSKSKRGSIRLKTEEIQDEKTATLSRTMRSVEIVSKIVKQYKQSRQGDGALSFQVAGENIPSKLSSSRHYEEWLEQERTRHQLLVSRNNMTSLEPGLSSTTPHSRPIHSREKVHAQTSVLDTQATFRERYRPAPILSQEQEEDTSCNDKATTRVITPASYHFYLRGGAMCNIGSPRDTIRKHLRGTSAIHSTKRSNTAGLESVRVERNPLLLTSLNSTAYQFPFSTKSTTCKRAVFPQTATYSCVTAKTRQLQHRPHPTFILSKQLDPQSAAQKIMRHAPYNFLTHANATDSLLSDEYSKLTTPSKTNSFNLEAFFCHPPSPQVRSSIETAPAIFEEKAIPYPKNPLWNIESKERFISEQGAKPEGYLLRHKQAFRARLLEKFTHRAKEDPRITLLEKSQNQRLNSTLPGTREIYSLRGQTAHPAQRVGKRGGGKLAAEMFRRLKRGKVFSDEDFQR